MIKFGPSGCGDKFVDMERKGTIAIAKWLKSLDLDCFEYSFGRGVRLTAETARSFKSEFDKKEIEMSVHAPYFINLATLEDENAINNQRYIFDSLAALKEMGGKRCVFHPGSPLKQLRGEAISVMLNRFEKILEMKHDLGYDDLILCPETMGKIAQLGDLDEIIALCNMGDDSIIPCIDWGHLNSREGGCFFEKDDYRRVIDKLINELGEKKAFNMHVHFSKIQFTSRGEVKHLTFEDTQFGPPFEPLMSVYSDYKMTPYIVCESAGSQVEDAIAMKKYFNSLNVR